MCKYIGTKGLYDNNNCILCEQPFVYICNKDYNILDDCYESCLTCSQSGTDEKMNCDLCKDDLCLVKGLGNCVKKNTVVDYYYLDPDPQNQICEYERCYETCKSCTGKGNILNHNCITCKENY